jgi:cytochrome c oxidase subunit 4
VTAEELVMSTPSPGVIDEPGHEGLISHPSDLKYIKVAIFLAIVTALEVATYFWESASAQTLAIVLIPMMIVKFAVVAGYFMHLKFDSPLFTRMFVAGLLFAVGVYSVMLTAFRFW